MKRLDFVTSLAVAAGAGALATPVWAADEVRFTSMAIDGGAQAWYAQTLGYFQAAGIDAKIDTATNGGAITAGVIGGAIDVGYTNALTLAVAHEKGVPARIIAPAGSYLAKSPISSLMVPADSPAKTARDLNGKTVAVNGIKNITQLATEAWSDANGGDAKSLHFVELAFPEMPEALAAHRIDAAFISEPIVSSAVKRGIARVIGNPYDAIAPEFTISVWFTMNKWSQANPALVRRISAVFRQSSQWANTHDSQSAQMLSSITKVPINMIDGMTRSRFAETITAKNIQPIIDVAARYGLLAKPFAAADLIDPNAV
jgi:NitT/TauT family transport system substrate-binding protein